MYCFDPSGAVVAGATLALRDKIIAGKVPGLTKQSDLFTDAWGHPTPPLQMLSGYCHFSVIYRRSPVGLPLPGVLSGSPSWGAALNRVLQQLARDGELLAYRHLGFWQCMDNVRERDYLNRLWDEGRAPWRVWEPSRP